jgi:hypothetical protein
VAEAGRAAQVGPERRLTVGSRRDEIKLRPVPKMLAHRRATTSRPWYSRGIGGMELKTSSVSRATSASRSADSYARTNFATIASSEREAARTLRSATVGAAGWRAHV